MRCSTARRSSRLNAAAKVAEQASGLAKDLRAVQFLRDERRKSVKTDILTVQLVSADFAAGSEVSGKNLCRVLKTDNTPADNSLLQCLFLDLFVFAVFCRVSQHFFSAFSALTLLVGCQEEHPAHKKTE